MRRRLILCLVAMIIMVITLGACSSKEEPTATPLPATKTPKPTFTLVPTLTTVPTNTIVPTPTRTSPPPTPTVLPTATLDPLISPLTGLHVDDPALLDRRVLAVRIGNDPIIRPQEGLGAADIVYEEVMEGWTVTRFTALYLESNAERIRPIRSARLSSLSIAPQYDAALVHSGASDEIRWRLSQATFVDLDQFFFADPYGILEGYDWRGRMYTSVDAVHDYLLKTGQERDTAIQGYDFDSTVPTGAPATTIHIPYPSSSTVDWTYDSASGRYLRAQAGENQVDALTGEPIGAENVIVFITEHKKTDIVEDSLGSTAIDIVFEGSGKALLCRDGVMLETKWISDTLEQPIQYYDAAGELVPLKPGKTWIQLVPPDYVIEIN